MGKTRFGIATIPATGTISVASGQTGVTSATITAHPSNTGVVYVKNSSDTVIGFPLGAGASLTLGAGDLGDFVASGASGNRVAFAYSQ